MIIYMPVLTYDIDGERSTEIEGYAFKERIDAEFFVSSTIFDLGWIEKKEKPKENCFLDKAERYLETDAGNKCWYTIVEIDLK